MEIYTIKAPRQLCVTRAYIKHKLIVIRDERSVSEVRRLSAPRVEKPGITRLIIYADHYFDGFDRERARKPPSVTLLVSLRDLLLNAAEGGGGGGGTRREKDDERRTRYRYYDFGVINLSRRTRTIRAKTKGVGGKSKADKLLIRSRERSDFDSSFFIVLPHRKGPFFSSFYGLYTPKKRP